MRQLLSDFCHLHVPTLPGHPPLLSCRYSVDQWRTESPAQFGVTIPDSLHKAVPKRLTEYVAGRALAHELLQQQGCSEPVGHHQEARYPLWPAGFIGSISHSNGFAACTVASTSAVSAIGLDVEHWLSNKTAAAVAPRIASPAEVEVLAEQGWTQAAALTAIFSAKEAIYKTLNPLVGIFFGFEAARLQEATLTDGDGSLVMVLCQELAPWCPKGYPIRVHLQQQGEFVLTMACLENSGRATPLPTPAGSALTQ